MKNLETEETTETTETTETAETTEINITELMKAAGAAWLIMETDTTYFQYGRTYRTLQSNAIERVDHRVVIVAHDPDDIQVLHKPCGGDWYDWDSKIFHTLKDALEWSERNVK